MDDLDHYRGHIAMKGDTGWHWCFLHRDYETVARRDEPNRHLRIQRIDGAPLSIERPILTISSPLTDAQVSKIGVEKHGLVDALETA